MRRGERETDRQTDREKDREKARDGRPATGRENRERHSRGK